MSKVSAIISAYFAEPYLEGRIENLLTMAGVPTEIIVVCRMGTPEHEIAKGYSDQGLVTTILDGGFSGDPIPTVYAAWNIGILHAKGDYLTNANSDDRIYADALKVMSDALDAHPKYSVAYTNINRVLEIGGQAQGVFEWIEGGLEELYWQGCFLGPMPMWRRSLHDKYGLFDPDLRSAGDLDFWMRLADGGEKFFHISQVYGDHLERLDALEHREPVRSIVEVARVKAKYRAKMEQAQKELP